MVEFLKPRMRKERLEAAFGWLSLALIFGAPFSGSAQNPAPVNGMLAAAAEGSGLVAATDVSFSPTTPAVGAQPPGLYSSPGTNAGAVNTTLSDPYAPAASESTTSGALFQGGDGKKNVVDIGTARRFRYGFQLAVIGTYDDNISLSENNKDEDFFFVIQPGITLGVGSREENFLQLSYTAGIFLYTDNSDNDGVQHVINFEGQYRFSKLTLSFGQQVQILDGADLSGTGLSGNQFNRVNLDVSGQTQLNIYTTRLGANYLLSEKTSIDLGGLYSVSDYSNLLDSEVISGQLFFNYAFSPKLTAGLGASGGYVFAESPTPDQSFEQANVRATYVATGKLTFTGTAGVEFRQSDGKDTTGVTPVFSLSATYLPFEGTSISLAANRQVLVSAVQAGQDYQSTTISLALSQRLFQRLNLGLSTGYENSHYVSVLDRVKADRDDNYVYVQVGLDATLLQYLSVGVSYQHRENFSSGSNSDFTDNQVSARMTLSF
jgi:hypothetical protein